MKIELEKPLELNPPSVWKYNKRNQVEYSTGYRKQISKNAQLEASDGSGPGSWFKEAASVFKVKYDLKG